MKDLSAEKGNPALKSDIDLKTRYPMFTAEHSNSDNPEIRLAQDLISHTGVNLFLTGKAGTGKTTFLKNLVGSAVKRLVVLAPTGIAAINAGGMTIHSFFQLPFAPYVSGTSFSGDAKYRFRYGREKKNIIRSMDLLVIDEISMVRADLLDEIDDILRRFRHNDQPFGGVQLLLIGDIQQLPPVANNETWAMLEAYYESPYFFSSHALKRASWYMIELKKVYRQNDPAFLDILNSIRENRCNTDMLARLNSRFVPDFDPPQKEGYIRLTTHNYQAQQINRAKLDALKGGTYHYKAVVKDNFPESSYPTDPDLELKAGAQVMFIKNDISGEHRFVNGSIGEVVRLDNLHIEVRVNDTQQIVDVRPVEWANAKYVLDESSNEIVEQIEGTFTQFPLKTAWAITIHKSQGLTFERAIIDASSAFAHGQAYVALSRCKTLQGLVLSSPIPPSAIIYDRSITDFTEEAFRHVPTLQQCQDFQKQYFTELLRELFNFLPVERAFRHVQRLIDEFLYRLYPKLLAEYKCATEEFSKDVTQVGVKFEAQYVRMIHESADYEHDEAIQERVSKACSYFSKKMLTLSDLIMRSVLQTDNKELRKRIQTAMSDLSELTRQKQALLKHVMEKGFDIPGFLKAKALLVLDTDSKEKSRKKTNSQPDTPALNTGSRLSDIPHPELYNALVAWRRKEAEKQQKPAYTILQQKAIIGLCERLPENAASLSSVPYIGKVTVDKYGDVLLEIIRSCL